MGIRENNDSLKSPTLTLLHSWEKHKGTTKQSKDNTDKIKRKRERKIER